MIVSFVSIGIGAVLGAWSRWGLGLFLNHIFPTLPLGTLAANLIGGFLIGIATVLTIQHPFFSHAFRLALITGFLGALTTFSTFSAESVHLFSHREIIWGVFHILLHVVGSLLATVLGIYTARALVT